MQKTKGMLLGSDTFEVTRGKLNITLQFHADLKVKISLLLSMKMDITAISLRVKEEHC